MRASPPARILLPPVSKMAPRSRFSPRGGIRDAQEKPTDLAGVPEPSKRAGARDIKRMASESGARHEGLVARGRPWKVIVRAAEEVEVNCIVMGPLRASALLETSTLDHPLSGGACRKVLRHARCSVLVVR